MDCARRFRKEAGFTIIVLLIVVAIIGIIVALATPNLISAIQRSRQSRTMADMRMISQGIEAYQNDHSDYPIVSDGTVDMLNADLQIYIRKYNHLDGWGEPFTYDSDGIHYTMVSFALGGTETLPRPFGPTNTFDADIMFSDGLFVQWPEGPQTN